MGPPSFRQRHAAGPGVILQLIRTGEARTRADLMQITGLSRSTLAQRLEQILAQGLIVDAGGAASARGRPPSSFTFNPEAGVVLSAGMGATHCRIGLTDLGGNLVTELAGDLDIAQSPDIVMPWIEDRFGDLLREAKRGKADVRAIGVGVPAPVEFALGTPVAPPIMPGWDGYPIAERLRQSYPVPVLVDKDTNTMACGEHWMHWRETAHLVYIKVGSGIGCGIVADGRVYRGADGAAGDIGHLPIPAAEGIRCICGNLGCLEAIAGGRAMAARLTAAGTPAKDSRAVVALTRAGDQEAMALVRESGRLVGQALTSLVNLVNPRVIVIGGDIAHADHLLLAGVRESIYQRSLPLATRHLRIVRSRLDDHAGLIGAAIMAIEHILAPEVVDAALARDEDRLPATLAAG